MAVKAYFGDILEPGFNQIYNDAYKELDRVFTSVLRMQDSDKQDERDSAMTGFGLLTNQTETGTLAYEDPIQMYDVVYTHLVYSKGFKITRELYDDDQYNIMNSKPDALGRAARRTEEVSGANIFNRAFNTSYQGGDAKPLVSTTHPRADAGTAQSNASATGITLTEANYETGKIAMRKQLDDKGMKIDVRARKVLIPIELEKNARIIFTSSMRSGTADNDMNPYMNEVSIVPWLYMDRNTTHWFLIDTDQHKVKWFWRNRAEFKQDKLFETEVALYKVRERFSNGFSDWRGVWGSQGDGAAYSS
jgi:hypothetical protein